MSPPPLSHGAATDLESDSDYLGTPVDPPSTCQPYVAEYPPLRDYYLSRDAYEVTEYVPGHQAELGRSGDSEYAGTTASRVLLRAPYTIIAAEGCNQPVVNPTTPYLVTPNHLLPETNSVDDAKAQSVRCSAENIRDGSNLSFGHTKTVDDSRTHYASLRLHYPECDLSDADCNGKVAYAATYSKTGPHFNLTCDTDASYPSSELPLHRSYTSVDPSTFVGSASYPPQPYYNDGYADSPIEESVYDDRFSSEACVYGSQAAYEQYQPHPQPHPDTHYTPAGSGQSPQNVRFYQPPACPYSYPRLDPPGEESGYASSPVSPSSMRYVYPIIHAPRPQQVTDIHNLHSSTCPIDNASSTLASHRILSIPSIPAPPPVPRPSSLIEDSPKKPLTLACFFCRKRKIACQSPPASSLDRTCNQCAKRKLKCVYPATSRRGIRPRVYDLADETFRRPSVALSM